MTHVIAFLGIMHVKIEVITSEPSKLKANKKRKLNAFETTWKEDNLSLLWKEWTCEG